MNEAEKTAFRRYYALRWWERDGGFAGDVTAEEIQVGFAARGFCSMSLRFRV